MEGTVQLKKDWQVAFEVMEPVYWDAERAVATTFRTDEQTFFIGRSKNLCKVGETEMDVLLERSSPSRNEPSNGTQRKSVLGMLEDVASCVTSLACQVTRLRYERDALKRTIAAAQPSQFSSDRVRHLQNEVDSLNSQLAAMREERDNGDGTITQLLPVTFPKGLSVMEVRSRKAGDMFAHWNGERVAVDRDGDPENVWLILRPAPKPPESIPAGVYFSGEANNFFNSQTREGMGNAFYANWKPRWKDFPTSPQLPENWEAPLACGEWLADDEFVTKVSGSSIKWGSVRGLEKPAVLGLYRFFEGVGTLIGANGQQRDTGDAPAS